MERTPVSVDELELYPLFTPEVLELMRQLLSPERREAVAVAAVIRARRL